MAAANCASFSRALIQLLDAGRAGLLQPSLRASRKIPRGAAASNFGRRQGGEVGAYPQRAVTAEPTPLTGKRPAAPEGFRGNDHLALLLLGHRALTAMLPRRTSPSGPFPEDSATRSFQTGSQAATEACRSRCARNDSLAVPAASVFKRRLAHGHDVELRNLAARLNCDARDAVAAQSQAVQIGNGTGPNITEAGAAIPTVGQLPIYPHGLGQSAIGAAGRTPARSAPPA